MSEILVGYARVSTETQDLTAQRDALAALGVEPDRIYVDHGFTGTNKNRAGLREALAACRAGDTFVVTKLDRLARSVRDAHEIPDDLANRGIKNSALGAPSMTPLTQWANGCSTCWRSISEFEADLIRMRTREGMKIAKAKGRLRGKQPKLTVKQENDLLELHAAGQ